jgi:hypothetical protein
MNTKRKYNKETGRDYRSDYDKFQSSDKSKKDRASRNKARREALRDGTVSKGDSKEIDHIDGNPRNNASSNKRVINRSKNRAKH